MDAETSQKLYETCYMRVYSYAMTLAKDRNTAEEITQETFFRAVTSTRTFRGESEWLTWLCAIAKNLFFDEMRRRSRLSDPPAEDLPNADSDLQADCADTDASFRIHLVLHTLEEPYREVFELRVFGELSFRQIGTVFGKTENWARVTYHRARLKVQERIGKT